jgi:hypothetical protein
VRIVTPFRHQDPDVLPSAQFVMEGAYLPAQEKTLRDLQDTDSALLGVVHPSRPGGGLSTARQIIREAVLRSRRFITAAGVVL